MNTTKDLLLPVIVLTVICMVITGALALTEQATTPIIQKAEAEAAEQAKKEVLPAADSFEELSTEGMPESITSAFKAKNGEGAVFFMTVKGYGGKMNLICGIGSDGKIKGTKTLSHSETAGLGEKTAKREYQSQYDGKDESLEGVDHIAGATISSKAFKGAVEDAFKAFKEVK